MDSLQQESAVFFYFRLLMETVELENHPFVKLVIENRITEKEYTDFLAFLNWLDKKRKEQEKEGWLDDVPLLVKFAGMLPYYLNIKEVLRALQAEGIHPDLVRRLYQLEEKLNNG